MYNLSNVHNILAEQYVKIINDFIGGEPAIIYDNQFLDRENGLFLARLCEKINSLKTDKYYKNKIRKELEEC